MRSQTKKVIANVYSYFEEMNGHTQTQGSRKETAVVTGVSCPSIKRLWKEKDNIEVSRPYKKV